MVGTGRRTVMWSLAAAAVAGLTGATATVARDVTKSPRHLEVQDGDGRMSGTEGATPSPKEIFDFRPHGAKSDAWRSPFVIDTDDGPLRDNIRRSNENLRRYREEHGLTAKAKTVTPVR